MTRPLAFGSPGRYHLLCHASPPTLYSEEAHETLQVCVPLERALYTVTRQSETGNEVKQRLGSRDVLVIPTSQMHTIEWLRQADIVSLQLSEAFLERTLEVSRLHVRDSFIVRDSFVSRVAKELRDALHADGALTPLFVDSAVTMIAAKVVLPGLVRKPVGTRRAASLTPRQLKLIDDYIDAHLDNPIVASELAALVSISTWHFVRRFQSSVGVSPHEYITQHRILRSQELLREGELSIMQIALEVGMTHSHFSRMFLERTEMSPREYRARERDL
jgi:AraC family transcriptional regulator